MLPLKGWLESDWPDNVRVKGQDKFPKMVMVWVAISPRGLSKPVFYRSGSPSVDSPIYMDKCLEKSVLPLIQEHHADFNFILASAHYFGMTFKWMNDQFQKYQFCPKASLSTKCPSSTANRTFLGFA